LLTQGLGWNWIFFINVPIGAAAVILTLWLIPSETFRKMGKEYDIPGVVLLTTGLILGVFAIVEAPEPHWGSSTAILFAALAVAFLLAFICVELRVNNPLIDLKIFRSRSISGANLTMFLAISGLFGFQFFTTLYLQNILGLNAMETGLAFLPAPVMIAVVSLGLSGWLNQRIGSTRVLPMGLAMIMLGLLWLSRVPFNGSYFTAVLPALVIMGIGFGSAVTVLMGQAMKVTSPDDSGLASGLINTTQQLGAAIGTAILSALSSWRTNDLLAGGLNETFSELGGYHLAFFVSAALLGVSIFTSITILRHGKKY
jgi:predicted MFS family arabinose efflux permease